MSCDTPTPMANFDGARYMGTWYNAAHSPNMPFQDDSRTCTTATYSDLDSNGNFNLYNSGEAQYQVGGRTGVTGTALASADGTGTITVSISRPATEPNYTVVDTDYENYSVVYNCSTKNQGLAELWYLIRHPVATQAQLNQYNGITNANMPNYDTSTLIIDN